MRVVIADDQRIVRDGLATIVGSIAGMEVVAVAADGEEAVAAVAAHAPDVVLMDLRMPRLDGVGATGVVRRDHPGTRVVVLTTYADDDSVIGAMRAGASGYLTKDASREDIHRALEAAAAGQSLLDAAAQAALVAAAGPLPGRPSAPKPLPDGLTEREAEVLTLIAAGLNNHEIAAHLYVSEATVKTHVNHIFAKTASRDRTAAAAYAHRHGLAGQGASPGR